MSRISGRTSDARRGVCFNAVVADSSSPPGGNRAAMTVHGDELADRLSQPLHAGSVITVDPPPESWATLKPKLFDRLREVGRGPNPLVRFRGYPLCGIGSQWRNLAVDIVGDERHPKQCQACSLAARCSPPAQWSRELSPYGPADPVELWSRWSARLGRATGRAGEPALDEMVGTLVDRCSAVLPNNPFILEPSVTLGTEPSGDIRLVTFHGQLPSEAAAAEDASRGLVRLLLELHGVLGTAAPAGLDEALTRPMPFAMPLGFEHAPGAEPILKAYVRVPEHAPEERAAIALSLLSVGGFSTDIDAIQWDAVEMIGIGSSGGKLCSVKAYCRARPSKGASEWDLPALAEDDPLVTLCGDRALAVIDLGSSRTRPHKWDLPTRKELLSGPVVCDRLATWSPRTNLASVTELFEHRDFRADVVAIALRGGRITLYCEIS